MLINLINLLFVLVLQQNNESLPGNLPSRFLKNITVTQGLYSDRINVEWEGTGSALYTVMRSQKKSGEFAVIAQTPDLRFEDLAVEKGVKYWYRVVPSAEITPDDALLITEEEYQSSADNDYIEPAADKVEADKAEVNKPGNKKAEIDKSEVKNNGNQIPAKPEICYSGCTSIETYMGVKLDDLIKMKKDKLNAPADTTARRKQKENLDYIQQYYTHPVKLTLFLTMSKPYFDTGELKILTDCDSFDISEDMRQVIFYNMKNRCMIVFYSKIIRKVISRTTDAQLVDKLLKNSELFCISNGKKFIVDKNGTTRLFNTFDAVGLSTRYLKNDSEWRSRTIMLSTSNPELNEKLKNASKSE